MQQPLAESASVTRPPWRPALMLIGGFTLLAGLLWWRLGDRLYVEAIFAAIAACF